MINHDQNINPAVVAFIMNTQSQQMAMPQQGNPYATAHLVVTDIECGTEGALFTLLNGSKFSLSYEHMVTGLQVNALNNLVLLSYQVIPVGGGFSAPHVQSSVQVAVENRVVALAASPMTAALIEPLRRAVTGEPQQSSKGVSQVTFETPLAMRGIAQDNFNVTINFLGYTLHANREVELEFSDVDQQLRSVTKSAVEWREEMVKWTEVSVPTHQHRILLAIIKARGQTPRDSTNDIHPRNTAGEYRGRSAQTDTAEPTPTDKLTSSAIDVSGMFVTGDGPDGRVHKAPVHSYQIVQNDGQEPAVQFFNEEGTMIATAALSQLVLSKYRQTVKGLVVEIMKHSATAARRATLIAHAEQHGVLVLADALKTLKH